MSGRMKIRHVFAALVLAYIAKAAIMHGVQTYAMNQVIEDLVVELETEEFDYRSNFPVLYYDVEIAPRFNLSNMGRAFKWSGGENLNNLKSLLEVLDPAKHNQFEVVLSVRDDQIPGFEVRKYYSYKTKVCGNRYCEPKIEDFVEREKNERIDEELLVSTKVIKRLGFSFNIAHFVGIDPDNRLIDRQTSVGALPTNIFQRKFRAFVQKPAPYWRYRFVEYRHFVTGLILHEGEY